jgi:hypothetical protein
MVDAKQLKTQDLSWFRLDVVRPAVVCSGHYIAQHRGACSGAAKSKAGEEAWPPSPWWNDQNEFRCCGRIVRGAVWMSDVLCPAAGGSHSFYRPRRGRITSMPHYSATWGGIVCSVAELAAALTVLATIWSSWRISYPNSGSFEGRGVVARHGVFRKA